MTTTHTTTLTENERAQLVRYGATCGEQFTAVLREIMHIGPRTRRTRRHPMGAGYGKQNVIKETLEAVENAIYYPGFYNETKTLALAFGWSSVSAWFKHVEGYRIDSSQRAHLTSLSPWEFTALLGEMVDAGITCVGEGERWFAARRAADVAAWDAKQTY